MVTFSEGSGIAGSRVLSTPVASCWVLLSSGLMLDGTAACGEGSSLRWWPSLEMSRRGDSVLDEMLEECEGGRVEMLGSCVREKLRY